MGAFDRVSILVEKNEVDAGLHRILLAAKEKLLGLAGSGIRARDREHKNEVGMTQAQARPVGETGVGFEQNGGDTAFGIFKPVSQSHPI